MSINKNKRRKRLQNIESKIIFESPFYKKRNQIKSTFRNFSRFMTSGEARRIGSNIWREAHQIQKPNKSLYEDRIKQIIR